MLSQAWIILINRSTIKWMSLIKNRIHLTWSRMTFPVFWVPLSENRFPLIKKIRENAMSSFGSFLRIMFLFRWIIIWEVYDKFDFTSLEKGNPEIFVSFNNGVLHCFNLPICELGFFVDILNVLEKNHLQKVDQK